MNGTCSKRLLTLVFCVFALGTVGCADRWTAPSWMPFFGQPVNRLPGVALPAERIAELRQLAQTAVSSSENERQRIAVALAESFHTEQDPSIRAEMVRTVGVCSGEAADAVLDRALTDSDVDVRIAACRAWGRRGDAKAVAVLGGVLDGHHDTVVPSARVLDDGEKTQVRLAAARALGEIEDPAAEAALGRALDEKNNTALQYRAMLSLRKIAKQDLGNNVHRWRQYARGELVPPPKPVSFAERLGRLF